MEEACWRMQHSEPWRHKLVAHVACALSGFCEIILASTSRSDAQAMPIVHVPSPNEESKYDQTPYMTLLCLWGKPGDLLSFGDDCIGCVASLHPCSALMSCFPQMLPCAFFYNAPAVV